LSELRKRRRRPRPVTSLRDHGLAHHELLDAIPARGNGRELEESELMARLHDAVDALPARYRDVFRTCVELGKTYEGASELLGIPLGTVAIRIMRARRRLFERLKGTFENLRRLPACLQR